VNDSQLNNEKKSEKENEKEESKKSIENRSIDESTSSEKIENEKATSEVISDEPKLKDSFESNLKKIQEKQSISVEELKDETNMNTKPATSVPSKLISIVPYDEDSTSSSSQIDTEQEKEVSAVDIEIIVKPQLVESASLTSEKEEVIDVKMTENVAAERQEVFEAVESSNKDEPMPETLDVKLTKTIKPTEEDCFELKKDSSVKIDVNEITNETETEKLIASDEPSNVNELENAENEPETSEAIEIKSENLSNNEAESVKEELQETLGNISTDNIVEKTPLNKAAVEEIPEETLNDIAVHDDGHKQETDNVSTSIDLTETTVSVVKDDIINIQADKVNDYLNLEKKLSKIPETETIVAKSEPQKSEEPEEIHEKLNEIEDINSDESQEDIISEKTKQQIEGSSSFVKAPVELENEQIESESPFVKENNHIEHSIEVKEVSTTNDAKNYDSIEVKSIEISNNKSETSILHHEDNFSMEQTKDLSLEKTQSHQESEANVSTGIISKKRRFEHTQSQKILPETNELLSDSREIDSQEVVPEPQEVLSDQQDVISVPQQGLSESQRVSQEVLSKQQEVVPEQAVVSEPQENISDQQDVISVPQQGLSDPQRVPQEVLSKQQEVVPEQAVVSEPQENISDQQDVISKQKDVIFVPQQDLSEPKRVPQEVLSKQQEVVPLAEAVVSEPKEALSEQNVISVPQETFSKLQEIPLKSQETKAISAETCQSMPEREEFCGTEINKSEQKKALPEASESYQSISKSERLIVTEESKTPQIDVITASNHLEEENLNTDKGDHFQSVEAAKHSKNQVEKPLKLKSIDEEEVITENLAGSEQNILEKLQVQEANVFVTTKLASQTDELTEISLNSTTDKKHDIVDRSDEAEFSFNSLKNETKPLKNEKMSIETEKRNSPEKFENVDSPEDYTELGDDNVSDREDTDESNDEESQVTIEKPKVEDEPEKLNLPIVEDESEKLNLPKVDSHLAENSKVFKPEPSQKIQTLDKNCVKSTDILVSNASSQENELLKEVKSNDIVPPKLMQKIKLTSERQNSREKLEKVEIENTTEISEKFNKPSVTRKRKISERKSLSESDSEGNNITDSVSHDNSSEDEEAVQKKKPRMRGKTTSPRKVLPRRAVTKKAAEEEKKVEPKVEPKVTENLRQTPEKKDKDSKETLQSLKFDYDGSEDVAANVAAIKTMICKDAGLKKETTSEMSEDEEADRKLSNRRGRKTKRGRSGRANDAGSSSDEDPLKQASKTDLKRSKTSEDTKTTSPNKKKRETGNI
jgi:hypothetical protein